MVQQVERLRPKLQARSLRQARGLEQRKIQIRQAGTDQDIAAGIAKGSRWRQSEGGSIRPMLRRSQVDALQRSTRRKVGPIGIVCIAIARLIKTEYGSEGEAALQADDCVRLPTGHQLVRDSFDTAQESLSRPERQLIDAIQAEPI